MQLNQSKRSRKSKLSDTLELKQDELPVCPKPRRPSEFVYPLNYMQRSLSYMYIYIYIEMDTLFLSFY